jgi:ubiquinone/menaquinone biosynthesis C-methylase UbiE
MPATLVKTPNFDQQAAQYDTATPIQSAAALLLAEQIAKTAKFGGRWLDVGCGTGKLSAAVLQQQSNRHITGVNSITPMFDELIGVDRAAAMLTHWQTKCETYRHFFAPCEASEWQLRPILADMTALPLPASCADGIMSSFALHWVTPEVLTKLARVLKPNGQLHLAIPVAGSLSAVAQRFPKLPIYPFLAENDWQTQLDALVANHHGYYLYQFTQEFSHEYANLKSLLHGLKQMGGAVAAQPAIETATLRTYLKDDAGVLLNYRLLIVGVQL